MALVGVHGKDLIKTREDFLDTVEVRVDPGSQSLSKVDCLYDGNLSSILLVFFEKVRQRLNYILSLEVLLRFIELKIFVVALHLR